jgi:hypothetical protein
VERVLQCDCGFEARAGDEGELVEQVQRHAVEAHGMALSPEQALVLAFRAQLGETAWSRPGVCASKEDIERSRQRGRRDS